MPQWWSWLLTAVGVLGLWAAGSKKSWGWLIGLGAQGLWIAYAVSTKQYGFLVSALAYGTVYGRNYRAWRMGRQADDGRGAPEGGDQIVTRWHRFWWAWGQARRSGCGIIESFGHALWFARSRGRITRQQKRAFQRRLTAAARGA